MADEAEIYGFLREAHDRGLIYPCKQRDRLMAEYINTARKILAIIETEGTRGILLEQVTRKSGLNKNTVAVYCRSLNRLGLINAAMDGRKTLYFFN